MRRGCGSLGARAVLVGALLVVTVSCSSRVSSPTASPAAHDASASSTVNSVAQEIRTNATFTVGDASATFDAARQRSALAWLSGYLARVHGDGAWLCSDSQRPADNPTIASATRAFAERLERAAHYLLVLSVRFTDGHDDAHACDQSHLAAPGVVVGPQTITMNAQGGKVAATYLGSFAYRVVDSSGRDEPMNGSFGATYDLVPRGSGWRLSGTEGRNFFTVWSGWPLALPLPTGYRGVVTNPRPVSNQPAAMSAVRAALNVTGQSGGVRWSEVDPTITVKTGKRHDVRSTVLASFTGGYGQTLSGHERFFDGGQLDINPVSGPTYADPGLTIPAHPSWYAYRPADMASGPTFPYEGEPYDTSPFAWLALLQAASSAAPVRCPASLTANACYAVSIDAMTAAHGHTVGADLGWEFVLGGETTPTMTVGITDGRLAGFVRGVFPLDAFGVAYQTTQLVAHVSYISAPPARPSQPPASSIVDLGTYN